VTKTSKSLLIRLAGLYTVAFILHSACAAAVVGGCPFHLLPETPGPTGLLQVNCQTTRQQGLNRFIARRILLDKIEGKQTGQWRQRYPESKNSVGRSAREVVGLKARMLADKSHPADKKSSRHESGGF
jgi:hypothetical protein